MRKCYLGILKRFFCVCLLETRTALHLTQTEMARRLAMDERSYIELDHGNSSCSALTLALFLLYCCQDPLDFLYRLRAALETEADHVA